MEIHLKPEHESLRKLMREFAERDVAPHASEIDETETFPKETVEKMARLNLIGVTTPRDLAGAGMDNLSMAIILEEVGRACVSTAFTLNVLQTVTYALERFGSEEQRRKHLAPLARGEKLGAMALTEPGAGSDPMGIQTVARLGGEGYVLNGRKAWVSNGSVADTYIIYARTGEGSKGISGFIVERGTPGLQIGRKERKLGLRGADTVEISLNDCPIPKKNLLGGEGDGLKMALTAIGRERVGIGAIATGLIRACLEASTRYAKGRVQFGKPISEFEAIQWMIADMGVDLEASRLLVYNAAWLMDRGVGAVGQGAMAKLFATEAAMRAAVKAVEVHGGYGCSKGFPVERYMRDAKVLEIIVGTSEIQRMIISRGLLS